MGLVESNPKNRLCSHGCSSPALPSSLACRPGRHFILASWHLRQSRCRTADAWLVTRCGLLPLQRRRVRERCGIERNASELDCDACPLKLQCCPKEAIMQDPTRHP
jgi:hypothetical protein